MWSDGSAFGFISSSWDWAWVQQWLKHGIDGSFHGWFYGWIDGWFGGSFPDGIPLVFPVLPYYYRENVHPNISDSLQHQMPSFNGWFVGSSWLLMVDNGQLMVNFDQWCWINRCLFIHFVVANTWSVTSVWSRVDEWLIDAWQPISSWLIIDAV